MQKDCVKAFKNDLRRYKYDQTRLVALKNSIEWTYERLSGVHGIDPSKEPIHGLPNKELEWKLRDDIDRYERQLKRTQERIDEVDEILARIETTLRTAIIEVYVDGRQVVYVADKMFISPNGLLKRINKAIEEAL